MTEAPSVIVMCHPKCLFFLLHPLSLSHHVDLGSTRLDSGCGCCLVGLAKCDGGAMMALLILPY